VGMAKAIEYSGYIRAILIVIGIIGIALTV
jgi:hypothetical protein